MFPAWKTVTYSNTGLEVVGGNKGAFPTAVNQLQPMCSSTLYVVHSDMESNTRFVNAIILFRLARQSMIFFFKIKYNVFLDTFILKLFFIW